MSSLADFLGPIPPAPPPLPRVNSPGTRKALAGEFYSIISEIVLPNLLHQEFVERAIRKNQGLRMTGD